MHASATIKLIEPRMLTKTEAASYCGITTTRFQRECSVSPIEVARNMLRYDRRDLDLWIDARKDVRPTNDEILSRA